MEAVIRLAEISKDYPLGQVTVAALSGVNLEIAEGEFTVIAGPSGSGKTTLLNLIGCMDLPTVGQIFIEGRPIEKFGDRQLTDLRLHKIGFIFQSFNLIGVLSVFQNVEFPLLLRGGLTRGERERMVRSIIDDVDLAPQLNQRPSQLSGGQRQRVAIARALVANPKIVLADEPTGNLDSANGLAIVELMKKINQQHRTTFIFSTHDPKVMEQARRIVKLTDGRIVSDDRPAAA